MSLNERVEQWLAGMRHQSAAIAMKSEAQKRPIVILSYAQAWDGSITTQAGEAIELSSQTGKEMTHALRSWHDGILVGVGTVIADDPLLTVREWDGPNPQPIVLDSKNRLLSSSKICQENRCKPWVLVVAKPDKAAFDRETILIGSDEAGRVNLDLALKEIYSRGIKSLMVEGGATVISSFLKAKLADAIILTIAPKLIGGYKAVDSLIDDSYFPRITSVNSHQQENELVVWGELEYQG